MTQEARAALNAYRREYYRNNKEKIKEYRERYWQKKADMIMAQQDGKEKDVQCQE